MKPSIVRKSHLKVIEQGKTLGRWIEYVIGKRLSEKKE